MVQDRTAQVLNAAIREFIRTGEPVSSGELFERYRFGIRPASIRNELHALTDEGYLAQSYHSAGRVPTDRGLEFFTERLLEEEYAVPRIAKAYVAFLGSSRWDDFLHMISAELGVLGVVSDCAEGEVRKDGLEDLVEHLNWESPKELKEVIRDFEALDLRMRSLMDSLENEVKVFIGKRSPITRSAHLSVVLARCGEGKREVVVAAIGPKRMDYEKVIGIFKELME